MTQRVMKAIDIFLDAINGGTLAKGTCTACAVGNLVAHGLGGKVRIIRKPDFTYAYCEDERKNHVENREWSTAFRTSWESQTVDSDFFYNPEVIKNIEATDFTLEELMQIEYAFEINTKYSIISYHKCAPQEIRADQINGLAAVVKVMLSFEDKELATDALVQELFIDKANLITIK
jgi:hypothetical protein